MPYEMNLQQRIDALVRLGDYMRSDDPVWQAKKEKAFHENAWFIPEFIELAVKNIAENYLNREALETLAERYHIPQENPSPKKVGIVMAGNIPLVGFHDLLCTFLTGHNAVIKPSSKDETLMKHVVAKLSEENTGAEPYFTVAEMLKGCDAYIATGSNNTARYFDYYFRKYPHIIRRNRTAVAVLTGNETAEELERLADDVHLYFGLGCRNVTKLYVPQGYGFVPLLNAFKKYEYFINHHKYKNNYDYYLAACILNNRFYMTNGAVLLVEDTSPFSPIARVHYEYYTDEKNLRENLRQSEALQCVVGKNFTAFGRAQCPAVDVFADNVDTIRFLMDLPSTR